MICSIVNRTGLRIEVTTDFDLLAEQAIELSFDHLITLAAGRFQALTIEDRDVAADIADQPGCLQISCCLGDTLATSPQHVGDELLGEPQFC
jgi:hypothetical protein